MIAARWRKLDDTTRGSVVTPEKATLQPSDRQADDATELLTEAIAPFIIGPPVIHPRNFFGRVYELKRIFDLWQHYPLQNVAIIGARRSGKTSLIHYLKRITTVAPSDVRPGQRVDWLSGAERYQWVLVDFQDARLCHQERLLRYLLTSLKLPVPNPCDLYHFLDIIADSLHTPTIILMDEIAVALESPDIDRQFWWSLRSLASTSAGGNLGFLLTASESPTHLAREHNKSSPFFNIFGYTCSLGPLTEEEARVDSQFVAPFCPS